MIWMEPSSCNVENNRKLYEWIQQLCHFLSLLCMLFSICFNTCVYTYTHTHTERCNVHKIMRSCELMLEHVTLFVLVNTSQDKNPWMRKWTNTPGQLIQWSKYHGAQSTIASAHPSSLHNSTCIDFHKPTIQTQLRDCGSYSSRGTWLEMLTSYRPSPSHC